MQIPQASVAFDYDAMLARLQKAFPGVTWAPYHNHKGVTAMLAPGGVVTTMLVTVGDRPGRVNVYGGPRLNRLSVTPKTAVELLVNVLRSYRKEAQQAERAINAMLNTPEVDWHARYLTAEAELATLREALEKLVSQSTPVPVRNS